MVDVSVTDNCGVASMVYKEGATVITRAHDCTLGRNVTEVHTCDLPINSASGSFTVTVTDNENPVVNVPANIAFNNDTSACNASVTFAATPTDRKSVV